ncbi:MAG: hypothetical protein KGN16_06635 [Burkholderiales bacterium]|nr:hypothetical protein [Burkholderiales bacterium]
MPSTAAIRSGLPAGPSSAGGRWSPLAGLTRLLGRYRESRCERAQQAQLAERAQEAAAVRAYAQRFASHDPRFVADLLAVAERHERSR